MRLYESKNAGERTNTAYVTGGPVYHVCMAIKLQSGLQNEMFSPENLLRFNLETENRYTAKQIVHHHGSIGNVFIIDYLLDTPMPCS